MEERIKLSDLLGRCLEFAQNPTDENMDSLNELIFKLEITQYLPLKQKQILLGIILSKCTSEEDDVIVTEVNLFIAKTIYGVLSYIVNLENDLDFGAFDYGAVDMLYELEIIDNVLKICNTDYQRLEKMVDETINFNNIIKIADLATLITPENIDKFTETVRDMKTELTPEKLEYLKSIAVSASPEFQALKETVIDKAVGGTLDRDFYALKKQKKENIEEEEVETVTESEKEII